MADRLTRHPGAEVGHQRQPQHLRPGGAGRDGLVHRRHTDQIRTQDLQHPDLGRSLVVRACHPGVDPLVQGRVDPAGQRSQPWRVGIDQVDEVGTHQRGARRQVEVVGDQNRLSHFIFRAQATRCVGQHQHTRAGSAGRPDPVHHLVEVVALVGVHPADQHQNPVAAGLHREHPTLVSAGGGPGETGQLCHRDVGAQRTQGVGRRCPA